MKSILIINGSASANSSNAKLIEWLRQQLEGTFEIVLFDELKSLPHFDADLSLGQTPEAIVRFREQIANADGVIVCTPEYVFSIPAGLKNALEWCVASTVFSEKPAALITASASGLKGHEALQLIVRTLGARLTDETSVLIQGIKGKIDESGALSDPAAQTGLQTLIRAFTRQLASR